MAKHRLNDTAIRNAKPADKDTRLNDGSGLYLLVKPNGAKWWRFDYSIDGKRKTLSLGVYPDTGLADARDKAEKARANVAKGIDPSDTRKADKAGRILAAENKKRRDAGLPVVGSFEDITRQWLVSIKHQLTELTYHKKTKRFEHHVFPVIGGMDIGAVTSPDVFNVANRLIAANNLGTAKKVNAEIGAVFSYAIARNLVIYDPAQPITKLIPKYTPRNRAALIHPQDVAKLLRHIDRYKGTFVVQCALKLSPLLFQRPGEIRQMEWNDIDLAAREWRYLVTKTGVNHIVPLSTQAIAILEQIKQLTGTGRFVFPNINNSSKTMSERSLAYALDKIGYSGDVMTPHGFRTVATTLLNEQGWSPDAIERQLAHMPKDKVRAAYNRAQYLDERRKMMQAWADYLDSLKAGADVIPFRKQG
jgi:integrase